MNDSRGGPISSQAVAAWRAAGSFIEVGGRAVFVLDRPATSVELHEPLLVLHGFPSCSFDFRHVLPTLAEHRRVVLCDFLGFGLSEKPDVRYSIRLHADVVEAVARHAGLTRVALLTHDMGDTVGGELLARSLEGTLDFEISRRVLTNGSIYIQMAQLTPGQQFLLSLPDERLDVDDEAAAAAKDGFTSGLASTFSPDHPASQDEMDAQWELVSFNSGYQLLPRTIRYIEDRRAEERRFTGAIETHPSPVAVVWGDRDPVAVYAMAERFVAARPGTPLVTLEDVGHYPMIEAPERFAEAVLTQLDD